MFTTTAATRKLETRVRKNTARIGQPYIVEQGVNYDRITVTGKAYTKMVVHNQWFFNTREVAKQFEATLAIPEVTPDTVPVSEESKARAAANDAYMKQLRAEETNTTHKEKAAMAVNRKADMIKHIGIMMVRVGTLESVKDFMQKLAYKKVGEIHATMVMLRARDFDGLVEYVRANATLNSNPLSAKVWDPTPLPLPEPAIKLGNPTPAPEGTRDRRINAIDGITALLTKYPEKGYATDEWYHEFRDLCWSGSGYATELHIIWTNSRCAGNDLVRLSLQMLRDRIQEAIRNTPVEVLNR